jgi:transcriptional regulator with XRE-family HTH domain
MDARSSLSAETVRGLREAKSWTQQHLADASGLSLRTVQRLEAEGSASAETRLAIAAALGVPAQVLSPAGSGAPAQEPLSTRSTWVFAACGAGALFVLALGSWLPANVASHFGVTGSPDGYLSREAFVASMCTLVSALPSLVWWSLGWSVRAGKANLPNAPFWLAPERREHTAQWLLRHGAWLAVLLCVFLCFVYLAVVLANLPEGRPAALSLGLFLPGLGVFLAALAAWLYFLERQFQRLPRSGA